MLAPQIKNGVIYGDENILFPSHLNYGQWVLENILAHKDEVGLINGSTGEQITYSEMAQKIVNIATSLTKLGVKVGDVVAICSENRIEYLLAAIGAWCCGAVVTFFNIAYTKEDLIHGFNISRPKYVFLSGSVYDKCYVTMKNLSIVARFILFDKITYDNHVQYKDLAASKVDLKTYQPVNFQGQPRIALILYSSGTTGMAKGVKLTHLNIIVSSQQVRSLFMGSQNLDVNCSRIHVHDYGIVWLMYGHEPVIKTPNGFETGVQIPITYMYMSITKNIKHFTVAPWSSTMGIMFIMREIVIGRTHVFCSKYEEELFLTTIQKYKVGVLVIAPPLLVMLYKSALADKFDLSSVEYIYSGGAPIDINSIQQVKKRFPHVKQVVQGYGMTESSGAVTEDSDVAPREGSVGRVSRGNIVKVTDPETNKTVGPGESGEIRIKGLVLFNGYVGKDMKNEFDEEGFYKTGDIAYYDEDGYFFIVDRIKELIKYKAWQVAPSELEAILLKHDSVKDVGIVGKPDELAGELPTAFVVKQPGSTVKEQDIIEYVANKVAPWKKLRGGVIFLNEIPKTPSGKILRRKLQSLLPKQSPQKLPASKL